MRLSSKSEQMLDHGAFVAGTQTSDLQLISQWLLVRAQLKADKIRQAVWRGTGCARSTGENTQRTNWVEPSGADEKTYFILERYGTKT